MNKFKPCPHCGGTDIRYTEHHSDLSPTGVIFSMCCYACGATFPNRYKLALLVEAWNRRFAPPEAVPNTDALVEALQGALLCIDDEVNIYAPEMCDAKRVEEARARHGEGGTLYYYAKNISACRAALQPFAPSPLEPSTQEKS